MEYILEKANVLINGKIDKSDVIVKHGMASFADSCEPVGKVIDASELFILPGLIDVHVHFREPGFSYKETIKTGTMAAARGGYTDVCTMPNLNPVPDSFENLSAQMDLIKKDAVIGVHPYCSITKAESGEELVDFAKLSGRAIAFSDDGKGVQSAELMERAMLEAKKTGSIIAAHCEDNSLLEGGYIHKGEYAAAHGHRGISSESEYRQIERDIGIAKKTGCAYHVCHISTAESVELIRQAKADGVDITCETAPHYLVFNDMQLKEDGRFKMNPPIRGERDRLALIEGIKDGTIDMIATDHAPHSAEEKSRGLERSLMGVVGLETAFPVLYTYLVKAGVISLAKLTELMHYNPSKRFNINSELSNGSFAVFDFNSEYDIDPKTFLSKGRATPFSGMKVTGECVMTFYKGELVWHKSTM